MRDLMFAFVWMALLPLSLMSAHAGVLVWVWVALLSPGELLYGFMAAVPFNKIVAVTTLALVLVSREKKDGYLDATSFALILLGLTATASWLGSIVSTPDGTDLYLKLIKELVLAFTIMAVMTTRHRIHLLVLVVAISFGFLAVKEGLIFLLTAGGHKVVGTGSVGDNNSLATALLMTVPLLYYLAQHSAVRIVRIGMLTVMGLAVVTIIATFSRGGFVGLLVLAAFTVKNSKNKFGSTAMVIAAGVLTYFLAPESWFSRIDTLGDASSDGSFMGRVIAWKVSWLIAVDNPFFGGGMHAVQRWAVWNSYTPLLYLLDFIKTPPLDGYPHAAHSTYFEVIGDLGFVGFAVFMTLIAIAFWNCSKLRRLSRGHLSLTWANDLGRMMQISLVIYVVTTAALSMAYFELLYIFVALLSRACRTVQLSINAQNALQTTAGNPRLRPMMPARPALAVARGLASSPQRPGLGNPVA